MTTIVSIPFIAGQWSLRTTSAAPKARRMCFNPLHCGAVVASRPPGREAFPCLGFNPLHCGAVVASERRAARLGGELSEGFNPLHCGAVVASPRCGWDGAPGRGAFQSPSLRGSGRFGGGAHAEGSGAPSVSIPFIAGQWSLRVEAEERAQREARVSIPFIAGQWSLRGRRAGEGRAVHDVSIPFIAGQWSLRGRSRKRRHGRKRVSIPFIAGQWSLLSFS